MLRSKIKGALIGGAIGDSWGIPVETWTPERIEATFPGGVHRYTDPIGHKWFKPEEFPAGSTTDDTQLHVATMTGLMNGREKAAQTQSFDDYMDAIAAAHVESLAAGDGGCGPSTREAIHRLAGGTSWRESGRTSEPKRGTGNGIPMKVGALSAWYATPLGQSFGGKDFSFNQACIDYGAMTHYNKLSAQAGLVHARCVLYCLQQQPANFSRSQFLDIAKDLCWMWSEEVLRDGGFLKTHSLAHLNDSHDQLATVIDMLERCDLSNMGQDHIRRMFGGGDCYVYDSLPFTYAFFLRNPQSTQSLDDIINAGGDTDTNGKMLGEMLGALHGIELFEQPENRWMLEGLRDCQSLMTFADRFCDEFGVE